MAKSPSYKINIDTGNLKQIIANLDNLSKVEGKVGEQAEKSLESMKKLLVSVEQESKVTKSQLESVKVQVNYLGKTINDVYSNYSSQLDRANKKLEEHQEKVNGLINKYPDIWDAQKKAFKKDFEIPGVDPKKTKETLFEDAKTQISKNNSTYQKYKEYFDNFNSANYSTANISIGPRISEEEKQKRILLSQIIEKYRTLQREENERFAEAEKNWKEEKKYVEDVIEKYEKYQKQIEEAQKELGANPELIPSTVEGTSKLSSELSKAQTEMNITGTTTGEYKPVENNSQLNKVTKNLLRSGIILQAFKRVVKESVNAIRELDEAITNMTVVTGESRKETEAYVATFAKIAQATSSTITEIADLTTEFVRQGRSVADAMTLAEETAKAAKIAGISVRDSLTYMTSAINGFNLAAEDAAHVSDVFAKLAAESATDYNQLAVALSKVSAQANQAGMSIEYTTALLAKGIETTQEAPESIGTALKTIIARFRELSDYGSTLEDGMDVNKVEKALHAVGIELRDESGQFRNLSDVLNELGPKWDTLNTMQQQAIAQAAAGTRQQSRFLAIMQDWERTVELVDSAQSAAGASAAQYSKYAKGLTASLTNLRSAYQLLITGLTESEWIIGIIDLGTDLMNIFGRLVDVTGSFFPILITGFGAIAGYGVLSNKLATSRLKRVQEELEVVKHIGSETKNSAAEQVEAEQKRIASLRQEEEAKLAAAQRSKQEAHDEKIKALEEQKSLILKDRQKEKSHLDDLKRKKETEQKEQEAYRNSIDRLIKLDLIRNDGKNVARYEQLLSDSEAKFNKSMQSYDQQIQVSEQRWKALGKQLTPINKEIKQLNTTFAADMKGMTESAQQQIDIYKQQEKALDSLYKKYNSYGAELKSFFGSIKASGMGILQDFKLLGKGNTGKKGAEKSFQQRSKDFQKSKTGGFLATAALTAAISFTTERVTKLINAKEEALSAISELMASSADYANQSVEISNLYEEYKNLSNQIYRTAEEEARLQEIRETMSDEYNVDISNIDKGVEEKMSEISGQIGENTQKAMAEAFKAAAIRGKKIFEDTEFKATLKTRMEQLNAADTSTPEGRKQSEIYNKLASNYNYEDLAKSQASANNPAGGMIGGGLGGAAIGGGALAAAGLIFGLSNPIGWAALAIAAVGLVVNGVIQGSSAATKKSAEEVAKMMTQISGQFNDFAAGMADVAEKSLATQYAEYNKLLNSGDFELAEKAIQDTYAHFEAMKKLKISSEDLNRMQLIGADGELGISNDAASNLIEQAGKLGVDAATEFIDLWKNTVEAGMSSTELAAVLSLSLSGGSPEEIQATLDSMGLGHLSSKIDTSLAETMTAEKNKKQEENKKAQTDAENNLNLFRQDWKAFVKDNKQYKGMSYSEVESILLEDQKRANQEYNETEKAFDDLQESLYDLITPIEDILGLTQVLTSLESSAKKARDFADKIEEGTATLEDWSNAAIDYADILASEAWANAKTDKERADLLRQGNSIFDSAKNRREQIDAAEQRFNLETDTQIAELRDQLEDPDTTEEEKVAIQQQIEALEEQKKANQAVYEALRDFYDIMTEAQVTQEANKKAIEKLDKAIEKGSLTAYDQKNTYLRENAAAAQSKLNSFWGNQAMTDYFADRKDFEKWQKAVKDLYNGNAEAYQELIKTLSEEDQEYLKNMYNSYSEYQTEIDEINEQITQNTLDQQDAAIEAYKQKMEREYNETKESLDKRKELYEKYFDAIDKEVEEDDYESERSRLLNAIGSLSTSTDMASLNKRKELEKELADLEKERRETERDELRDNVMERIEEQQSEFDKIYEEATENNRAIWQQFVALGEESMEAILQLMKDNAGFDNMTFEQQWAFLQNHTNLTDSVDDWIANAGQTYSAEAMKGMNLDQQKAQMIQDFTREYSNVFGDFNFQIDASQVTGTTPEEIARSIFDVFRKEMSKRGITANQKK